MIELDGEPISVSGPDENGDVVFLETSGAWGAEAHRIVLVSLRDGRSRTLLDGDGRLDRYHSEVEIAPRGSRIAFLRVMLNDVWSAPSPPRELFVLDGGRGALVCVVCGSIGLAILRWLPDGRRIAFEESSRRKQETWILDVESGERRRLGGGSIRTIAADGSVALLERTSAL